MKTNKTFLLFLLLALLPLAFAADWVPTAASALVVSTVILALLFMVGHGFGSQELLVLAKEELYQLAVTLVMLAILIGGLAAFDELAKQMTGGDNLQDAAIKALDSIIKEHTKQLKDITQFARGLGYEASKSSYCSLQGVGYNIAGCGSYRQLMSPVSLAFSTISFALAELESVRTLVSLGQGFIPNIVFPLGILLRAFKVTRGAGAFLIAFGVSIYFILPVTVIAMNEIIEYYTATASAPTIQGLPDSNGTGFTNGAFQCEEEETGLLNYDRTKDMFDNRLVVNLQGYVFAFLVKGTFTAVVSVFAFITSLRWFSRVAGVEVDVSSLMRLA